MQSEQVTGQGDVAAILIFGLGAESAAEMASAVTVLDNAPPDDGRWQEALRQGRYTLAVRREETASD